VKKPQARIAVARGLTNAAPDKGAMDCVRLRRTLYMIPLQVSSGVSPRNDLIDCGWSGRVRCATQLPYE